MATVPRTAIAEGIDYPSGDGKPMAETPRHRQNMTDLIAIFQRWYASDPMVYVSGNMFVYYVRGDKHKHVSPDVFVTRGVPREGNPPRDYYLIWEEGKGPELVIEMTSRSTREEDVDDKFWLYQDTLKVREYFLFDPYAEYLNPPLIGYRLGEAGYSRIEAIDGRLPSEVLGLHFERNNVELRLYDPAAGLWLPTSQEALAEAEAARQQAELARSRVESENERLRQELEALRRRLPPGTDLSS